MKTCPKCNKEKEDSCFYLRLDRKGKTQSYCKDCNKKNAILRQREFKKKCVEYKGGKCECCGYNRCCAALDFHHRDPSKKDFLIVDLRFTSFEKNKHKILPELDKCMLVCANCHREIHSQAASSSPTGS